MTFEEHLKRYLSEDIIEKLLNSLNETEQKGLVLNTEKLSKDKFLEMFPCIESHPYVNNAFLYNKTDYEFGKNPLFDLGAYYIQDPSAMLVAHYLNPIENDLVLDMCAAPGGKTNHASLLMHNKGQIVANDLSNSRSQILLSNVERMGRGNIIVSSCDLSTKSQFFIESFDKIILDAPCSGSGMFRRMKEMQDDWSIEKVYAFSKIQKSLIQLAASFLKPNGMLIYSTCSYSYEEDEEVILEFLANNPEFETIRIGDDSNNFYRSKEVNDAIHLFPCFYKGEGHFICLLHKIGDDKSENKVVTYKSFNKMISDKHGKKITEVYQVSNLINEKFLEKSLRPGLFIKTVSKDGEVPSHHYAKYCDSNNSIELSSDEYKSYIHGETINKKAPNGYYFVSYLGLNVGVSKCVNNVLKNYYPKGLRR